MRLRTLVSASSALVLTASVVFAASSTVYEKAAFKPALDAAVGKIYKNHGGKAGWTLKTAGGPVTHHEVEGVSPGGGWKIGLGNGCELAGTRNSASAEYGKLMVYNAPAVIGNNRDGFLYAFQTQVVEDAQLPYVEKQIASRRKGLMNEFKDMKVSLERQADKTYRLDATYSYAGGVSPGKIEDRLYFLMRESEWLLCDIHTGFEFYNINRWKDLKGSLTTVSRADFIMLYPTFKESGYEANNPQNPFGDWQLGGEGYNVWVENRGTDMRLWLRIPQPYDQAKAAQDEAAMAQLKALAPAKGATSVETYRDTTHVWLGSVYPYSTLKGKEIEPTVNYYYRKYAPGAVKDVKKILKNTLK